MSVPMTPERWITELTNRALSPYASRDDREWFLSVAAEIDRLRARVAELERERQEALELDGGETTLRGLANECCRARMHENQLERVVKALLWPNVPSADDVALLVRMCGTTADAQESAMELVARLRVAQQNAEQLVN